MIAPLTAIATQHILNQVAADHGLGTGLLLIGTMCVASFGCFRWVDPLGLATQSELGEQPEFQRAVNKDRFPTASQLGLSRPKKPAEK